MSDRWICIRNARTIVTVIFSILCFPYIWRQFPERTPKQIDQTVFYMYNGILPKLKIRISTYYALLAWTTTHLPWRKTGFTCRCSLGMQCTRLRRDDRPLNVCALRMCNKIQTEIKTNMNIITVSLHVSTYLPTKLGVYKHSDNV